MNNEELYPLKELEKVSDYLNLDFYPQDWGIINGSANRIEEFIVFLDERKNTLINLVRKELYELIISSFNELMLNGDYNQYYKTIFLKFLNDNKNDVIFKNYVLAYWKTLTNEEEMPISKYLKDENDK